jgi:parallel beta-helix repeat protein
MAYTSALRARTTRSSTISARGNKNDGIFLYDSNENTIANNTCTWNANGIHLLSASSNKVKNNNCLNNINHGIYVGTKSENNSITYNTCRGNKNDGIRVDDADFNVVANNTCTKNTYSIYIRSASKIRVKNNTLVSNDRGLRVVSSYGVLIYGNEIAKSKHYGLVLDTSTSCMVMQNAFLNNNGATGVYNASHVQAYGDGTNYWYSNHWNDRTTDKNHDGTVDVPYRIDGGTSVDAYPLAVRPSK